MSLVSILCYQKLTISHKRQKLRMIACGTYSYESATTTCSDANYATLMYFLGYGLPLLSLIYSIGEYEADHSMSIQDLAIVFAQTLWSDETRWWEYGMIWR